MLASLSFAALLGLLFAISAGAGTVGTAIGFEDDDGNLADNDPAAAVIDWNSFDGNTWSNLPNQGVSTKTDSGWQFKGLTDWQATTADSGFAGGTKQDDECASVGTQKADNKADLKRIYMASKTGTNGHTYLMLSWVRIPQNTTSPSAHIAFEFNKGKTGCGSGSKLVHRTAGDLLVLYDFEGGTTDVPTIRISRWITAGACEVSSDSPPCWNPNLTLTAGQAEAKVNTTGSVQDKIAPTDENLGTNEFGEAGIDLTNAHVFDANTCETFGTAFGVSRTSGNSGTAQMKDIVGPTNFSLTNCGQIKIVKRTNPRGANQSFGFTSTIPAASTCTTDTTPAGFTLNDNGNSTSDSTGNTEDCTNVPAGSYTVTEGADPSGFTFASLSCTASTGSTGAQDGTTPKQANISIVGGGVVTCVYTNNQNLGAIKVTKTRKHAADGPGDHPQSGVSFTVNGVTKQTGANGVACFDQLPFNSYTVHETVPNGYHVVANDKSVTVDNSATCADATYAGETVSFHNTPLTDLTASVDSQVDGGTASTIECKDAANTTVASGSTGANGDGSATATDLEPGTYTCTVVIDP